LLAAVAIDAVRRRYRRTRVHTITTTEVL
jgi:hypothetical protein